jgi:AmmeMemoRadiSam system protein A/AmmeMemoRadiSam system protein B
MPILAAYAVPHPPIIIPQVGRGEEKKIAATAAAYDEAMRRAAAHKPDVMIITSPHAAMYADYFHISPGKEASGSLAQFRAPGASCRVKYDTELADRIEALADQNDLPAGSLGERDKSLDHATLIPLLFLAKTGFSCPIVRIGLSGLSTQTHYRLGQTIAEAVASLGRNAVFIASGDLSHKLKEDGPYGFAPEGPEFDKQITEIFASGDFGALLAISPEFGEAAGECGLRSFQIMAGALDKKAVTHELLSYEGPFGVGYGVGAFEVTGEDDARDFGAQYERLRREHLDETKAKEDPYVRLARLSLETRVRTGRQADRPADLPPELTEKRSGTFVSLKIDGRLRGCIGTISPTTTCIAEEILQNAVSAGLHDPRFDPVRENELNDLTYSVDVLGEAESIPSADQLDPKRYGVIVQNGARRGLLLPDLEGVDTAKEQIAIAKKKAGIGESELVRLSRFEVVRHR